MPAIKNMKILVIIVVALIGCNNSSRAQLLTASDTVAIRVSYFTAAAVNSKTVLKWKVTCFLDYARFEVQRSSNGSEYTTISTFSADKLRCLQPFDLEDSNGNERTFYRLKVGDRDGKIFTSQVLVAPGTTRSFEVLRVTPSIVTTNALLSISSAVSDKISILVTSMEGALLRNFTYNVSKGNTDVRLPLGGLAKGIYTISIRNSNAESKTIRLHKL